MKLNLKPLFIERMKNLLSEEDFEKYLEAIETDSSRSIRCNTLKTSPENLKKRLEDKGWKIAQPFNDYPEIMIVAGKFVNEEKNIVNDKNSVNNGKTNGDMPSINKKSAGATNLTLGSGQGHRRLELNKTLTKLEPGELGRSLEHILGYYYVQEIASMLPVLALKPEPNQTVLDLCSSPGSKTTQIAACMKNIGTIIANEISLGRIKILASNSERCGVANVIITKKEGSALCKKLSKENFKFDKILIDAPCSGEGTLKSSPKTAKMWNINTIKRLSKVQKNLIESAIEILEVNGEMVYSTCTHAPEENEQVVDFVLKNFKGIKIEAISFPIKCRPGLTEWAGEKYNEEVKKSCRIYPQDNNTDGFFIAKFRRIE